MVREQIAQAGRARVALALLISTSSNVRVATRWRAPAARGSQWRRAGGCRSPSPVSSIPTSVQALDRLPIQPGARHQQPPSDRRNLLHRGFASCRAFLYDRGRIVDLDSLVADGYGDYLYAANDINARGEITGEAVVVATGESVAFTADPHGRRDPGAGPGERMARQRIALPESARRMLLAPSGVRPRD